MDGTPFDDLAPEVRFTVRALAAGAPPPRLAELLRADRNTVLKHLRVAARAAGAGGPPAGADDEALVAALEPLLDQARQPPGRAPATKCPSAAVLSALSRAELDGPLLLAELEHVADCPGCLRGAVEADPGTSEESMPPPPSPGCLGVILLALGTAVALGVVILRR